MIVPAKWSMCFTVAMIALIMAMAFLAGPRSYIKNLFLAKNLWASILLIASMCLAVWSSLIEESYIYSLLFCLLEMVAVIFYFFNTAVVSMAQCKWICRALGNSCARLFRNV
jgi:hypothetical protein